MERSKTLLLPPQRIAGLWLILGPDLAGDAANGGTDRGALHPYKRGPRTDSAGADVLVHACGSVSGERNAAHPQRRAPITPSACIAALLYGKGDFFETMRHAFNSGWDADNNAATSGTVIGVTKGYKWITDQPRRAAR
jgi:ADP-ribosylglycohydrolase